MFVSFAERMERGGGERGALLQVRGVLKLFGSGGGEGGTSNKRLSISVPFPALNGQAVQPKRFLLELPMQNQKSR